MTWFGWLRRMVAGPNRGSQPSVRVLLFVDGESWIAQGLEYDIASYGDTPERAILAFDRTVLARLQIDKKMQRAPMAELPSAPQEYWDAWEDAIDFDAPESIAASTPPTFVLTFKRSVGPILAHSHA